MDKQHELKAEEEGRIRAFGAVILVGVGAVLCFERSTIFSLGYRLDGSTTPPFPSRAGTRTNKVSS
jgi:hypothetical protein